MFLIDVSPSMGKMREVEVVDGLTGDIRTIETTNLDWSLQYVKLKIQEMVCSALRVISISLLPDHVLDL